MTSIKASYRVVKQV